MKITRLSCAFALTAATILTHAATASAVDIYGIDSSSQVVLHVTSAAPATIIDFAHVITNTSLRAIDFRTAAGPNQGALYAIGLDGSIQIINTGSLTASVVGSLKNPDLSPFTILPDGQSLAQVGLAYQFESDSFYAITTADQYFKFNPDSGIVTSLPAPTLPDARTASPKFDSLAFGGDDGNINTPLVAYAVDTVTRTISVTATPDTGVFSAIGSTNNVAASIGANFGFGLDVDPADGTLYLGAFDNATPGGIGPHLYTVDTNNAALTNLGYYGAGDDPFTRGDSLAIAPVPEPASLSVLVLGTLALLRRRRR